MAITSSAKKAIRVAARRRVFNLRRKRELTDKLKEFRQLITAKKLSEAEKLIPLVYKAIDKAAKGGVLKPNTAARRKSQVVKSWRNAGAK